KIINYLGINFLIQEIHNNFIALNALEKYIRDEDNIEIKIKNKCKENNITDSEHIKQLIKSQKIKNYLSYNKEVYKEIIKDLK
ncbi:MAG: hypothetical protein SVO01_00005, partial [Thermotogota bacterium]|nr:hypothetical protein [Thermotogota bacterium]